MVVGKKKPGITQSGEYVLFTPYAERDPKTGNLVLKVGIRNRIDKELVGVDVPVGNPSVSLRLVRFKYYDGAESKSALGAVVADKDSGRPIILSYNDYFLALATGLALRGGVLDASPTSVRLGGRSGWARAFTYDFISGVEDVVKIVEENRVRYDWETLIKYLMGSIAPEVYKTRPEAVGLEVNAIDRVDEVYAYSSFGLDWLSSGDRVSA